jgi:hypothetical protein
MCISGKTSKPIVTANTEITEITLKHDLEPLQCRPPHTLVPNSITCNLTSYTEEKETYPDGTRIYTIHSHFQGITEETQTYPDGTRIYNIHFHFQRITLPFNGVLKVSELRPLVLLIIVVLR